ncbi:hypothetical protein [Lysinibacillus fusiformis]
MAPVKSVPFRIVEKPRDIQVGEVITFEDGKARISSIKKIEFLPGNYIAVIGLCRGVKV